MRKPMLAANEINLDNDWHDFVMKGDTEPRVPVAPVSYVDVCEVETLRLIEATLQAVEEDSDHAIALCTAPESVGSSRGIRLAVAS